MTALSLAFRIAEIGYYLPRGPSASRALVDQATALLSADLVQVPAEVLEQVEGLVRQLERTGSSKSSAP